MTTAYFMDGRTAARHAVSVTLDVDGQGRKFLRIAGDGVDATWPVRTTRRVQPFSDIEARFQLASSDARLVLPMSEAATILAGAPELFRKQGMAGPVALVAGLAIVAGSVAAAAFILTPMLAGPIARSTPLEVEQAYGATTRQMIDVMTEPCALPEVALAEATRLAEDLARAAGSPFETDLHFVEAGFPNAFAMPGGRIMVTAELIALLDSPDELAGVMAHETAHVARRHVMAALVRELGGAAVIDLLVGGGSGAGQQIALAGLQMQSLRHGRAAEREADELAVQYLSQLNIDPVALAAFFEQLGKLEEENDAGGRNRVAELFSTHPQTARRAEEARALAQSIGRPANPRPALSAETWAALKEHCSKEP